MSLDVSLTDIVPTEVFTRNITHNLTKMADAAGIYEYLWQPEEKGVYIASQLVEPLTKGLDKLLSDPDYFKTLNPQNGWGSYDGLVSFVDDYILHCKKHPNATVSVCR